MPARDCRDWRRLLSAFIEGDMPAEEASLVSRHLETCAGCRREAAELRRTVEVLRRLPQEPAPPEILRGVRQAIRASRRRASPAAWAWARWARVAAPAAAVLLVGLAALLLPQRHAVLREEAVRPPRQLA